MLQKLRSMLAGQENRRLFVFYDGQRKRAVDPLAVWCKLNDDPAFVLDRHLQLVDVGDVDALKITTAAVRRAFGLPPWSEAADGLTEAECLALIGLFLNYMAALKKKPNDSPTLPSPTELKSSAQSITKPESDCSKTLTEPNGAMLSESGAASG